MAQGVLDPPRRFLVGLLARSALLLAATVSLNVLVDPFGAHGTGVFEPITLTTRRSKLRLYEKRRPAPEIVILGSSRSFAMEPAYVEAETSSPAFNAAVAGAQPADYLDLASCLAQGRAVAPTFIVGLGVEQLLGHADLPIEGGDPLAACRPRRSAVESFVRTSASAVGARETRATFRVLALEVTGRPSPAVTFAADGTMLGGFHGPPLEEAVEADLAGSRSPSVFAASTIDPQSSEEVRQLLELSRQRHGRVIVYLPPYHPRALERYQRESHLVSLRAQLLARLRTWTHEYPLAVYDFTDPAAFGGRSDMFYDAWHPREDACRLMLDVMLRRAS